MKNPQPAKPRKSASKRKGSRWFQVIIAGLVACYSIFSYFNSFHTNPITGERQQIELSIKQEIGLGLQASPHLVAKYGGLDPLVDRQKLVVRIGGEIVEAAIGDEHPYDFGFRVLRDDRVVNAFALPNGHIFITAGLLNQLTSEGELAGILAHQIAHVAHRHAAELLGKAQLTQALTGDIRFKAYDPNQPETTNTPQVALALAHLINLKYRAEDELEADRDGIRFMAKAGYDPRAMIRLFEMLEAGQNGATREFFTNHPNPKDRTESMEQVLLELYPDGVPETLKP